MASIETKDVKEWMDVSTNRVVFLAEVSERPIPDIDVTVKVARLVQPKGGEPVNKKPKTDKASLCTRRRRRKTRFRLLLLKRKGLYK